MAVAFACRRWGTLPAAGGWLDQPVTLFTQADYALQVYDALSEYDRMRKGDAKQWIEWQKHNGTIIELVAELAKAEDNG